MRSYQLVSLLAITAGVAFIGGLRLGEHRGAKAVRPQVAAAEPCCGPAKPAGAAAAKPPAIPTGSGRPCLAEFGSDECNECQRMRKVLTEISPKLRGRVDIVQVDTDVHLGQAQRWRLRMVPTQILVSAKGQEVWRHEGYLDTGELAAKIRGSAGAAP
jgi:thioredoxin 1